MCTPFFLCAKNGTDNPNNYYLITVLSITSGGVWKAMLISQ